MTLAAMTGGTRLVHALSGATPVRGKHAVTYWGQLLHELIVKHMDAQDAISTANTLLLARKKDLDGNPITEPWQVVLNSANNVTLS